MKNLFTLLNILLFLFYSNNTFSQMSYFEDFESYSSGSPIAQTSSHWNSWDEIMNNSVAPFIDDCNVIDPSLSSPITAYSGLNTLYFKENNVTLKVFDISGKEVIYKKVSNKEQIDMSQLSKGTY